MNYTKVYNAKGKCIGIKTPSPPPFKLRRQKSAYQHKIDMIPESLEAFSKKKKHRIRKISESDYNEPEVLRKVGHLIELMGKSDLNPIDPFSVIKAMKELAKVLPEPLRQKQFKRAASLRQKADSGNH